MRVYQRPFRMDMLLQTSSPDTLLQHGWAGAPLLVENKHVNDALILDFTDDYGLALYAKNMSTLIDGLAQCSGKNAKLLKGQIFVLAQRVGDASQHKNVTLAYVKGKTRQASNNIVKGNILRIRGGVEKITNQFSRTPEGNKVQGLAKTQALGQNIGFDPYLWRDGESWEHASTVQRDLNMAKGHAAALVMPAKYRMDFAGDIISPIDNGVTTLGAVAKLVRVLKSQIDTRREMRLESGRSGAKIGSENRQGGIFS